MVWWVRFVFRATFTELFVAPFPLRIVIRNVTIIIGDIYLYVHYLHHQGYIVFWNKSFASCCPWESGCLQGLSPAVLQLLQINTFLSCDATHRGSFPWYHLDTFCAQCDNFLNMFWSTWTSLFSLLKSIFHPDIIGQRERPIPKSLVWPKFMFCKAKTEKWSQNRIRTLVIVAYCFYRTQVSLVRSMGLVVSNKLYLLQT